MKKKIVVCMLITCMLGVSACGKSEEKKVQTTEAIEQDVTMQESKENNYNDDKNNALESVSESEFANETDSNSIIEETTTPNSEKESSATEVTENSEGTSIPENSSELETKETEITEVEITDTENSEPLDEEQETSDEELSKRFFDKYYGDKTGEELEVLMLERAGMMEESSFYDTAMQFWQEERGATDTSYKFSSLYYTDMRYYSEEDFKDVPIDIIVLAWNEIYARHGYRFKDENIENYFMGCLLCCCLILPPSR